ncbi:MAG TPA: UDP-N-acetylmuramate--L-alanine ligase [Syntrophomonadaceae bacterium]|nr:UDP-N-acetylmuramate--L-alanine ligase [Syntrophomonadaceae bacterium]
MPGTPGQWIHMVGIAGAGMSGIARVLVQRGFRVSGSDLQKNLTTQRLEEIGVKVVLGHSSSNICEGIDLLVVSSAIPADNEELVTAQQMNIPIIKRGQMLAELVNNGRGIAVAGAHGKTTTTSMIFIILEENELDPTFIVGGELKSSGLNAKLGSSDLSVVEADESDASFLDLRPFIAVVTNVEDDHLDYYKTRRNIEQAFAQFLTGVQKEGLAILNGEDLCMTSICEHCPAQTIMYGENSDCDYYFQGWKAEGIGSRFDMYYHGQCLGTVNLAVPGKHNASNAVAAIATAMELGIGFAEAARAILNFKGAKRRFHLIGTKNQITIVDDYAHHPTEIKATLEAARGFQPERLVVVFQPHRFTRTKSLGKQLGEALATADLCIVTEIYAAGEVPIPEINGSIVAEAALRAGGNCIFLPGMEEIATYLLENSQAHDLLITMGAGDIWRLGTTLLDRLPEPTEQG